MLRSPVNSQVGVGRWPRWTNQHLSLIGVQPVDGEVGELDLRYNYEPQQDSWNAGVTPVAREQPPFAPNYRLAVANPRISV
jgi:hypothetical protein